MKLFRPANYGMHVLVVYFGIISLAGAAQPDPFGLPGTGPGLPGTAPVNPFAVSGKLLESAEDTRRFEISVTIPFDHYLYVDQFSIQMEGHDLKMVTAPGGKEKKDPISGEMVEVYNEDVRFVCEVTGISEEPFDVTVKYQGCNDKLCFMPETEVVALGKAGDAQAEPGQSGRTAEPVEKTAEEEPSEKDWKQLADGFKEGGRVFGKVDPEPFRDFLDNARQGKTAAQEGSQSDLQKIIEEKGWIVACLLILLGGLALNLTPCVLPMIPINIAIIGAGAQAGSRGRGLLLGTFYGAGMAAVYGVLGVVVVLTGTRFGELNASPWFNVAIAVFFVVLALGMFDIIHIDFSRFQAKTNVARKKKGSLPAAFILGGIIALLAGACVAPVVISVVLFATELYAGGAAYGLLLPFLLGIGMALPWPFAGAGLSFLPKPGKWMEYVKYGFGVIILVMAVYYGYMAYQLFQHGKKAPERSLYAALAEAQEKQKPIFIDFWATWCKSCLEMERTTFKDGKVKETMQRFVVLKYQAEDLKDPETKEVLDYFGVKGLPAYIVLLPKNKQGELK